MNLGGLGTPALAVALVCSSAATVLSLRGRRRATAAATAAAFAALSVALVVLGAALVAVDGSLVYVADHTRRATGWPYRLAGLWGGMAGSLLLWAWMAAAWAVVVGRMVRRRAPELAGPVQAVLAAYVALFCVLLVVVSPPFSRLAVPAVDGGGLNPVLLHPAMLYHPPLLYAGAVGLVAPFALALAGLRSAPAGAAWLALGSRAAGVSLLLLGGGLLAGAHWAYVELGWGGYWAWDPVENGGLLPWLAGLAFLHAAAVDRRRGRSTTSAALAALAFVLGLVGAFLTRSGASESVHAFAEAGDVGVVLGAAVVVTVAMALVLLVRHRHRSAPPRAVGALSVVRAVALSNALLVALVVVVGFGTVFPVVAGWVTGDRMVVTGRYFALVTAPLAVALLVVLGVGPRLGWTTTPGRELVARLRPAWIGLVGAGVAVLSFADRRPLAVVVVGLAAAAGALTVAEWRRRPRARWPVAHLGVAVLLAGVAGTTTGTAATVTLAPGEDVEVRGYVVRLEGVAPAPAPDGGRAAEARVTLSRDGAVLATLRPVALLSETGQRVSVAALRSTPLVDVQVALRAVGDGGRVVVLEVGVVPLMQLVWWGGLLLVAGLAFSLRGSTAETAVTGAVSPRPASSEAAAPASAGAR